MKFPLMRSNFSRADLDAVIDHLRQEDPILTSGSNCREFEREWSEWLGVKYSVFVNSGSSANLLSMTVLKIMFPNGGEIIVPPLTWVSDIASIIQTGFKPVFADINLDTLAMDTDRVIEKITPETRAVFLSHIQGFNGLTEKLIRILEEKNIPLIEDVCESHGATHGGRRVGSFGLMSNFSFYYAHHMSTIEGGMISTDDEEIYETLRMLRAHGMIREMSNNSAIQWYGEHYPKLNPKFIFAHAGFNVRNNEIGGILGRQQLRRLDENNLIRTRNHNRFLSGLNNEVYKTDFYLDGASNYAFNLILNQPNPELMSRLTKALNENGVEFRLGSAGGGNQLRQPYLKDLIEPGDWKNFPHTEHVHFYGMYIGNFPALDIEEVDEIVGIINSVGE